MSQNQYSNVKSDDLSPCAWALYINTRWNRGIKGNSRPTTSFPLHLLPSPSLLLFLHPSQSLAHCKNPQMPRKVAKRSSVTYNTAKTGINDHIWSSHRSCALKHLINNLAKGYLQSHKLKSSKEFQEQNCSQTQEQFVTITAIARSTKRWLDRIMGNYKCTSSLCKTCTGKYAYKSFSSPPVLSFS